MGADITAEELDIRLDHIAYAANDTDAAISTLKFLYPVVELYRAEEPSQGVFYSYLVCPWNTTHKIEIVEPAIKPSPIDKVLSAHETVIYHVSYRLNDFGKAVSYFKNKGYFMVSRPFEPKLEKGIRVCHFLHPKSGVIEIMGELKE